MAEHPHHTPALQSLNAMSISLPEEILARQLQDTDLSGTSSHRVFGRGCRPPITSEAPKAPIPEAKPESDGWGENPPSYTSISLHHRFGYQSVLSSSHLPLLQPDETRSQHSPPKLFGGYTGQSIVFGENPDTK